MLFLSSLYPTNRFSVAKFHAQISTKLKKQRHWFNAHSLKSFKTFRDHKSRLIVLLDSFSAKTREPLKVYRQVKHCKKGFRENFQVGLTASYICIRNFLENPFFALFLAFLGKILMILKKIISTVLAFLQGLYLASSAFRDYTKSLTIISGLGKNNVATKKQIGAKKVI